MSTLSESLKPHLKYIINNFITRARESGRTISQKMGKITCGKSHTITPIEIKDIFAPNNTWGKAPEAGSITFKKGIFGNAKYNPEKHFVNHYLFNALATRFAHAEIAELIVDWFDGEGNELDDWRVTFSFITPKPFSTSENVINNIPDMLKGIQDCLKNALIALKRDTKK